MNRKGFTLIELLAVLVVLGIVLVISIPSITDAYKNSKIKSEEAFVQRLTQTIDSYVKLNSDEKNFECREEPCTGEKTITEKKYNEEAKQVEEITKTYPIYYQQRTETIQNIIDDGFLSQNDFVNPGNKEVSCNTDAQIEVYKDSDFVYCYKVERNELNCLIDKYDKDKDPIEKKHVINTCTWK